MWVEFWKWLGTLPPSSASFVGTVTGSSLGLIALLLGALFNARLNRRRDDKLRDADRVALASALHAELSGIYRSLTENAQGMKERPPDADGGFVIPALTVKVLPETLSEIGLLRPETITKVITAYNVTEHYLERLMLAGGKLKPNVPNGRQLVRMESDHIDFFVEFSKVRAGVVKEGLDALSPYLRGESAQK